MNTKISLKAVLVVIWAFTIAGAAVASESRRICVEDNHAIFQQLHTDHLIQEGDLLFAIVTEADVTN